jgi:hypothetical protein
MGVVYQAWAEAVGRPVALKCLHANLSGDPEIRRRFAREARVLRDYRHPNVIQVYDYIEHDYLLGIVMELVLGPSTVTALTTATEVSFDVKTTLAGTAQQVNLDLGANSDSLSLDADTKVTLNSAVGLNFTFGISLGEGLAASEAFFLKLKTDDATNPTGFKVTGSINAGSFSFPLGGKVGFLEVGIGDGTAYLGSTSNQVVQRWPSPISSYERKSKVKLGSIPSRGSTGPER